ncbi:MAG: hypothetical protein V5A66_04045 [Candidatus Thermoplasmatota archaeon]
MKLYFSHPTFTFHTETERSCIDIIEEHLEYDELVNPADFGLRKSTKDKLKDSDGVIAMAVSTRFTYLVWNELEINGKEENFYTFMVESRNSIGPLVEGIPDKIERLSKEESKKFSYEITKKDYKEGFLSSMFGSRKKRF